MISQMNDVFCCRWNPGARLEVRGSDAATFLQGQFTNDLRRPAPGGCTYGLWLNQKGRVLADSFVLERGSNAFEIVSLSSPAAGIRERVEAYIIADDVELADVTPGVAGWIVSGPVLDHVKIARPEVGAFVASDEAVVFRARATGTPNWYLVAGPESAAAWADRLAALERESETTGRTRDWLQRERIAAGLPEIGTDLGPGDLPNEGGLEHEAISFTKGCYLGQEVMARLHNLGQVRRRLFVVESHGDASLPPPSAELFKGEKRVGDLRSVAPSAVGPAPALAMVHTTHVSAGDELAGAPNGTPVLRVLRRAEGRAW